MGEYPLQTTSRNPFSKGPTINEGGKKGFFNGFRQNSEVVGICSLIGGDRNMQKPLSDFFERVKFSLTYTEIP